MTLTQWIERTGLRAKNMATGYKTFLYYNPESNRTIPYIFEENARTIPRRTFVMYKDRTYDYAEANRLVNRYAHAYLDLGLKKGDIVAIMLENRPEYFWHFFALGKIGVTASLINNHLTGDALAHAIGASEPKKIIVGTEVLELFETVRDKLGDRLEETVLIDEDPEAPGSSDLPSWNKAIESASTANPKQTGDHVLNDLMAYIYTSGTTGLPKAALVKHHRLFRAGHIFGGAAWNLSKYETIYNCLPLYHGNGMMLATMSAVTYGAPMALARKFSAHHFWDDVRKYDATCFIYIGELCRYLMNMPPSPDDQKHRIRAIAGNGLRPDVWEEFQERFGIDKIVEFYAATEGNAETMNIRGEVGACGILIPGKMALAKWDEDEQDFVRTGKGRLIKAKKNEPGVLLGKIKPKNEYVGYRDSKASEERIVRDAFSNGDSWYNTGDLLKRDWKRNLFFMDRLGDTYRWKGENVSTFEVQEQISGWEPVDEVNVYGVQIEGTEGRAGMAAIVLADGAEFAPEPFQRHVESSLPNYARPVFVRIDKGLETTGTLKLKKRDLQKEGFDPEVVKEPLWFFHTDQGKYVPLDGALHAELMAGKVRL